MPTVVDILRKRAATSPDRVAFRFSGSTAEDEIRNWAQLDCEARAIAAALQSRVRSGERALLLYPPGIEFISAVMGCLYAGVIATPLFPPNPARMARELPRIRAVLDNAQARIALAPSDIVGTMPGALLGTDYEVDWLATGDVSLDAADRWKEPRTAGDTMALLQYTSGSTSQPRGVLVRHQHLMANLAMIAERFGPTEDSVGVFWLPLYHDMGLICAVFGTIYCGGTSTLMSPMDFLHRPMRWLEAVSTTHGTISGGPDFAYNLCVDRTTEEERASLDLSSWEVAFTGAETIRPSTLERFANAFAPYGFRPTAFCPAYGLAEATLFVAGVAANAAAKFFVPNDRARSGGSSGPGRHSSPVVSCGPPALRTEVKIVDPDTCAVCPKDAIGEIWIQSPSAADGYWNDEELTVHTFGARIAGTSAGVYLRTGDLGTIQDGELVVMGRIKDLIVVRGKNHYPQDIEATVEQTDPRIRKGCVAAFTLESDQGEQLVIVAEARNLHTSSSQETLERAVQQAVTDAHGIRAHSVALVGPATIPKTSSGKIRRSSCRDLFLAGVLHCYRGATKQGA